MKSMPLVTKASIIMALGATGLTLGDFFIKKSTMLGVSFSTLLIFAWPITIFGLLFMARAAGGIDKHIKPRAPKQLLIRCLLLLSTSFFNVTSLIYNPYPQHAMLFLLSPVFAFIISIYVFKEKLTTKVALVLGCCLLGTWLILNPDMQSINLTLLLAVAAAFSNSLTASYVAANSSAATPIGFTFWAVIGLTTIIFPYWLIFEFQIPSLQAFLWIQLSAIFAVLGIFGVSAAMQTAPKNIGQVSIMLYVQMPVAIFVSWLAFNVIPSPLAIVGGVLIISAGCLLPLKTDTKKQVADT